MKNLKKALCIFLTIATVVCTICSFGSAVSATNTTLANAVGYNYTTGHSTYITKIYNIPKNKKVTLNGYWINSSIALSDQKIGNMKIKSLLMFDVHIIDTKTGKVVNYWYNLKVGDKFKIYSAVPNIDRSNYQVKVTSYLSNYRTYVNSNLSGVATTLKYALKY